MLREKGGKMNQLKIIPADSPVDGSGRQRQIKTTELEHKSLCQNEQQIISDNDSGTDFRAFCLFLWSLTDRVCYKSSQSSLIKIIFTPCWRVSSQQGLCRCCRGFPQEASIWARSTSLALGWQFSGSPWLEWKLCGMTFHQYKEGWLGV